MFLELTWPALKEKKAAILSAAASGDLPPLEAGPLPADASLQLSVNVFQFQIGDFTLGEADCPSLTGHPYIRY
jgi:hypothetical protein